jgi:hypothetical protein
MPILFYFENKKSFYCFTPNTIFKVLQLENQGRRGKIATALSNYKVEVAGV